MQQTLLGDKAVESIAPQQFPKKQSTAYGNAERVQAKVGQDIDEMKEKIAESAKQDEDYQRQREAHDIEFNAHFKLGATHVIIHNGIFYFWGDVSHCGRESIFHNAREIRKRIILRGASYGHMSYNDLPTFDRGSYSADRFSSFWEKEEHERKTIYKDDLYCFKGDEICLVETVFEKEQERRC